ncbi:MAG TPA: hypothetical protein VIY47_09480 [Ignavibacteriaceae bacterium]
MINNIEQIKRKERLISLVIIAIGIVITAAIVMLLSGVFAGLKI